MYVPAPSVTGMFQTASVQVEQPQCAADVVGLNVVGLVVGLDVVGFFVGLDVVGLVVGLDVVGFFVGLVVGLDVVGFVVGLDVVGFIVGLDVVGFFVGLYVAGLRLGCFDGFALGMRLGTPVGLRLVGWKEVGSCVGICITHETELQRQTLGNSVATFLHASTSLRVPPWVDCNQVILAPQLKLPLASVASVSQIAWVHKLHPQCVSDPVGVGPGDVFGLKVEGLKVEGRIDTWPRMGKTM